MFDVTEEVIEVKKDIPEYIKSVDKKLNELYNYKPKNIIEHEL